MVLSICRLSFAPSWGGGETGDKIFWIFLCCFNINIRDFAATKTDNAHFHWKGGTALWAAQLRARGKRSCWPNHCHSHPQWGMETTPLYNNAHGQKPARRSDSVILQKSSELCWFTPAQDLDLIWRKVLIITTCPRLFLHCAKRRGKDGKQNNLLRTKCSWKNMHDTDANAWKHLAKMGRRLKFSPSTLMGTHWNLTTALSYGNTTALVIQAVRLEILTSTSEGGKNDSTTSAFHWNKTVCNKRQAHAFVFLGVFPIMAVCLSSQAASKP